MRVMDAVQKLSLLPENPFDLPERCQAADRSRGSRCAPTDAMARTDPGQEGTLLLATLFSMATTFCLYKLLRQFKSTRRTLNKFVRLSKQGPFYRGGSWLLGTLMRRTRGTAAIAHWDVPDCGNSDFFINVKDNPHLDDASTSRRMSTGATSKARTTSASSMLLVSLGG